MTGQRLPRAYRSRPRPSSALGAKASTVCPCSLDQKNTGIDVAMEFSRCARARARPTRESRPRAGLSKLNSMRDIEVDVILGELNGLTAETIKGFSAYRRVSTDSLERR